MGDEKPLNLKKKCCKPKEHLECIVHYDTVKRDDRCFILTEKTLSSIRKAAKLREVQGFTDYERQQNICRSLPTGLSAHHGYHRKCYQIFTNTTRLLKRKTDPDCSESEQKSNFSKKKKRRQSTTTHRALLPQRECIFCGKRVKKSGQKFECLKKLSSQSREKTIKLRAEAIHDAKIMAYKDVDLVAKEARYHLACYHQFVPPEGPASTSVSGTEKAMHMAHDDAFRYICRYVEESIIQGCQVERITMLKEKYLMYMSENHSEFYNSQYKTDKLKVKLVKHFGQKIQFWRPNYRSELVYSSNIQPGEAVETAFEAAASDSRLLEEAALVLRRVILSSFKSSDELPWPPPSGKAMRDFTPPPALLQHFVDCLISGNTKGRIIESVCHDIMYAVTNGKWVTSKHLLLAITLWHLTGKAEIITLLNRFGHSVSYSRVLEALTAVFIEVKNHPGPLPPNINPAMTSLVHFWFDNFDLQEETPSGRGTTHTTHGLICQEKIANTTTKDDDKHQPAEKAKRTTAPRLRSVKNVANELPPCYVSKKQAPPKFDMCLQYKEDISLVEKVHNSDLMWILARRISFHPHEDLPQTVPGWKGWVSCTGKQHVESLTTLEYLPPIPAPITENCTVQECLTQAQAMTNVIGQHWTIVCFDLAAAKKAYAITWQYPNKFPKMFIRLGAFHTISAYWGAVWKSMEGSGVEQIIIQSDLCASGSISKVLSGKHYNRCRFVLKTLLEALERLLLEQYEIRHGRIPMKIVKMLEDLGKELTYEKLQATLNDPQVVKLLNSIKDFEEEVRCGKLGKTGIAWMNFMDKIYVGLEFLRATAENNLDLHISSLRKMCVTFFNMDRPNYAR